MSDQREVTVTAYVKITVNDPEAVTRVTGDDGDEWRSMFYDLYTEEDVYNHLAYNAVANGIEDASRLDGWADLQRGAVTMIVTDVTAW